MTGFWNCPQSMKRNNGNWKKRSRQIVMVDFSTYVVPINPLEEDVPLCLCLFYFNFAGEINFLSATQQKRQSAQEHKKTVQPL